MVSLAVGTFESPDGHRFERDIVHHPGAVVMVPYDERTGEVVFVRQYRAALDQALLEVPAGKRDVEGEPPEVTAVRELAEETGLEAGSWQLVGRFYNSPGFSDEESWCYLARDLRAVPDEPSGCCLDNPKLPPCCKMAATTTRTTWPGSSTSRPPVGPSQPQRCAQ